MPYIFPKFDGRFRVGGVKGRYEARDDDIEEVRPGMRLVTKIGEFRDAGKDAGPILPFPSQCDLLNPSSVAERVIKHSSSENPS